ncbi:MAG: NAD(P)/FAD-dependent oxidoreductase [Spirochaetes bacterium]|nr:NAD(P)/FAD-dependent oxidoreductase [Spirochaetota bacterium]
MKVVILGAGISGHTAISFLAKHLSRKHEIIVVSPSKYYQWIPSNIWVGVGRMKVDQVRFKLAKLYEKWGVQFKQAKAVSIHPEGNDKIRTGYVSVEYTSENKKGISENVEYDFLVNATGPKLDFAATPGLGPDMHTLSVCTFSHAAQTWEELQKCIKLMQEGRKQRILIGTGHPTATCQGAAFEYMLNIVFELKLRGLYHLAEITWISNEYEMGDFGMGGAFIRRGGYTISTREFSESILAENHVRWIKRAGIYKVEHGKAFYETLNGEYKTVDFDFAMLLPSFSGQDIKAFDSIGRDINAKLFSPTGCMRVDADYTERPFEEWTVKDWPETYQNPLYKNIYAIGIAFAPPHSISKPRKSPNGTSIYATPIRTGMPSGVIGKIVGQNISEIIKYGTSGHKHKANMGRMGASCILSAGYSMRKGLGATMTVCPIVPDWERFPEWGRDINMTVGEIGLAGHWIKLFLHYMFMYKAKGHPFWWLIPE